MQINDSTGNDTPLLSVLIPVYNTARYLPKCLDSIVTQSYTNLQIVILNDGSSDRCDEICREYACRDSRIEYYAGAHEGISAARNRLVRLAQGEYSIFIDSDDWIEADMFDYLISTAESEHIDILVLGAPYKDFGITRDQAIENFLTGGLISSNLWSKLVKTELFRQVMFDEQIAYGEDVMNTWGILNRAATVGISDRNYYHYNDTPGSITNRPFNDDTFSLHRVWDRIVRETSSHCPGLILAAERQRAFCYIWLLYTALRAGISPFDTRIKFLRRELWSLLGIAAGDRRNSFKCMAFARIAAYFYPFLNVAVAPFRSMLRPIK